MELSAKIKDVMNTHRLISVKPDDEVAFAARLMSWAGVRHLPVVKGRSVVGVFTERDYLRYRSVTGGDGVTDRVAQFMTSPAESVSPDDPAATASAIMLARRIGCIPVVDEGRLVGIITATDMLAAEVRAAAPRVGLDTPVAHLMVPHPAVVFPHQPLLEAVALMTERGFRHVPVIDGEGHLVGMVSDRDVRTAIGDPAEALRSERAEIDEMRVSSVMTTPAESIADDASLADTAERLAGGSISALPVVDRTGRVVGIVSYTDLVRALLDLAGGRLERAAS
ncbi:MAG TPA: CBS domain-containing protein [Polyangia bacterium]|nr:CBS domain-containing protein [Polyangia bacterium]